MKGRLAIRFRDSDLRHDATTTPPTGSLPILHIRVLSISISIAARFFCGLRISIAAWLFCGLRSLARSTPRPVDSTMASSHGNVIVCNNAEAFEQHREAARAEGKVLVIDFTASWCGPCKFMAPLFAELSEKYPNLVFLKVDVDEVPTVSEAFEVKAMPTFLFIDESGVEVHRLVGANKIELEKHVKLHSEKSAVAAA